MPKLKAPKTSEPDKDMPECPNPGCPYKRKVALLEYELKELRERYWGRKKKKNQEDESDTPASAGKRGAPRGHRGWFRKIGSKIDKFVNVTLERCPKCKGRNLTRCKTVEEHIQEDIILPAPEVTCFRHYSYWCRDCKEMVKPERPAEELPKSYIGPTAKALAVWMKYDIKISDRDLKRLFESLFKLKIVPASVAGFRNQLARYSINVYEQIQQALKHSSYVHSDETGWKVRGDNHYLWSLSNRKFSFFHVDKSRGLKVLQGLLGERFNGTLIVDFLRVYDRYEARDIQRCLVHLQREIKKILEVWGEDPSVRLYMENLKAWIQRARALGKKYRQRKITKSDLKKQKSRLQEQLKDFEITTVQKKPLVRIGNRIAMHRKELLTFLNHPQVDCDNNFAERQIRPNVLLRKITFGNDTAVGARNHGIFMSIVQTAKQNGRSPPKVLKEILLSRGKTRALELMGGRERQRRRVGKSIA